MRSAAVLLAIGLAAGVATGAQDPPQPAPQRPIFRGSVDVVQLEISVLDRDRHPVRGLNARDFEVREDGKIQPIVAVDEVELSPEEAPPPVWAPAVQLDTSSNDWADRRLLAIVMDDLHCCALPADPRSTDRWAIENAVKTAFRIVDGMGPKDLAVVILTHDAIPMDHFTNDRDSLRRAISRFLPITEGGCLPRYRPPVEADLLALLASAPQPLKSIVRLTSLSAIDYKRIPVCPPPSFALPVTGAQVWGMLPRESDRTADEAATANVPIYSLNVSGLMVPLPGRGPFVTNGPNRTGGQNFFLTNDLKSAVAQLLAENASYYAVGFRTSRPTTDGKYRRIDIRVTRAGEFTVRARRGYTRPQPVVAPGSKRAREELRPLPATVAQLLPSFDVTLQSAVAAFAKPGAPVALLAVTVDVTHPLPEFVSAGGEDLDMRTVAYASGDVKYDVHHSTHLDVSPLTMSRVTATTQSVLEVAPDSYELWLTARDRRTNRLGSVAHYVEVPDFTVRTVSISGIVLGQPPSEGDEVPERLAGIVPIVPTTSRDFGRQQKIEAFFQVYQARNQTLAPVTLSIKVLDGEGTTMVDNTQTLGIDRFDSHHAASQRLALPLESLMPGRYLLSVEARVGDRISPKRDVPFNVR